MPSFPPLAALRAFESAARLGGFVRAGRELNLTAGAVGHHVRQLEQALGVSLFERGARGVTLTDPGRAYARRIRQSLDDIADATALLRDPRSTRPVVIRCQFSVAGKWMPDAIATLRRSLPDIEVQVRGEAYRPDPFSGGADLAVYYSRGPSAGLHQEPLIGGAMVAVAAPERLGWNAHPRSPAELLHEELIHLASVDLGWIEYDWSQWFEAAGVAVKAPLHGVRVNLMHMAIELAAAGAGFALVNTSFATRELQSGTLVRCSPFALAAPHSYFLLGAAESLARPEVAAVWDALLEHATAIEHRQVL